MYLFFNSKLFGCQNMGGGQLPPPAPCSYGHEKDGHI